MGLSASQARLLTITSRKADCEYQSMRLSHQKIALSREMNEISNEYQNSLNQTQLYYDFYGKGDTSNPLTYSLLMTPSALNDYLPTLITNQQGRVVLDPAIAAAARAAGVPQEGLNGMPSEEMRNKFIEGLFTAGVISKKTRDSILSTTYNQAAGLGSTDLISTQYVETNLEGLIEALGSVQVELNPGCMEGTYDMLYIGAGSNNVSNSQQTSFNLADLLKDDEQYIAFAQAQKNCRAPATVTKGIATMLVQDGGFIDDLYEAFASVLAVDPITENALKYATIKTKELYDPSEIVDNNGNRRQDPRDMHLDTVGTRVYWKKKAKASGGYNCVGTVKDAATSGDYVGFVYGAFWNHGPVVVKHSRSDTAINLNSVVDTFLTYYAQYMNKEASTNNYDAIIGQKSNSNIVTDDPTFIYRINAGSSVSEEDAKTGLFYDTLFNQLCAMGWSENSEIKDQEYLQEMLKNGMMYVSSISDDGYYYQGNYSTNTFIKEVSDDSAIAQAEAKYTNQKARLTSKEDEIDLKMKNLDTEISSLTTEYDSVKSVIDKNIEKSFKRYNA